MTAPNGWDLLVVGGGPAGAAAAISARSRGLEVLLLEAETFPRHHVGESLVKLWHVFEQLGVSEEMDATFQHKRGSGRIWGRDTRVRWTDFSLIDSRGYSLQVERSLFDQMLVRRAAELGACVREGHRVVGLVEDGDRVVGVRYRTREGQAGEARGRLVLDATGRAGLFARRFKLRSYSPFYPDLSVYGYAMDAERFPGGRAGTLFIEAVPVGWLWFIPLHNGAVSVGIVCDRSSRHELTRVGKRAFLCAAVRSSSAVARRLRRSHFRGEIRAAISSGYCANRYTGKGWLMAGDAAAFIDPMWATGVANALRDGIRAAAVAEAVSSGEVAEEEALDYYGRSVSEQAERLDEVVRFVYAANRIHAEAPFWRNRHRFVPEDEEAEARTLEGLAPDPSVEYFRAAFLGMRVTERGLSRLDMRLAERARWLEEAKGLVAGSPEEWRPRWRPSLRRRAAVGVDPEGKLRRGLQLGEGDERQFTAGSFTIAALELIDGRRSVHDIVETVLCRVPAGERYETRFRLLAGFAYAHARGAIEAGAAGTGGGAGVASQ